MTLLNKLTGDVMEFPPPDRHGRGVVLLNGRVVERLVFDDAAGTATTEDGRVYMAGDDLAEHLVAQLLSGAWMKAERVQ